MDKRLNNLIDELNVISHIRGIISILQWDLDTYMPKGSISDRSEKIAYLTGLVHKKISGDNYKSLLSEYVDLDTGETEESFSDLERRMLFELHRDWKNTTCIPLKFIEELSKSISHAKLAWLEAKQNNNFTIFSPMLDKIVKSCQIKAEYIGYESTPYDALIDQYEPGLKSNEIDYLFIELHKGLSTILDKINNSNVINCQQLLFQYFDKQKQRDIGIKILQWIGYDFTRGRLDNATHPLTTSTHLTDVRITANISENSFLNSLSCILHEGGHALYEQGLNAHWHPTPICKPISLGIHESLSQMWEKLIGRSKQFWSHWLPNVKVLFADQLDNVTLEDIYMAANTVSPSAIRVQADEVTYNTHIIIRYEIEKMLINDNLSVNEIPSLWNSKYNTYLKVQPKGHFDGALQDAHWSHGLFGYFPIYAIGNLYSIHWTEQAENEIDGLWNKLSRGEIREFCEWLHINIHNIGRGYSATELLDNVSGKTLTAQPYLDYLNKKYSDIYRF